MKLVVDANQIPHYIVFVLSERRRYYEMAGRGEALRRKMR